MVSPRRDRHSFDNVTPSVRHQMPSSTKFSNRASGRNLRGVLSFQFDLMTFVVPGLTQPVRVYRNSS
jgi:hypothetical protein